MLMSVTCFFFWMMPNMHKIRSLFSFSQVKKRGSRGGLLNSSMDQENIMAN
jgi:hypothetical protein